ncbi:class I SAM-dependent methyltransferase [Desulfoscipio sp. XC116]|uniref:class I SAM-dependent methyltransferase n=1 Tax=Desulfoscipio sp. XC116 TaxID=3144975 RepID=UPI00325B192C
MSVLSGIIQQEITSGGPITFARFMEQALYHPELGYYTSPGTKIGRAGDFYTAPGVSPLFGAMLARRLYQMWDSNGRPDRWVVAEYGPGTGILPRDITTAIHRNYPDLHAALEYYLIEISSTLKELQQKTLSEPIPGDNRPGVEINKFHWISKLTEINPGYIENGCILANELVDAFPVHLVEQNDSGLAELYVSLCDNDHSLFELAAGPPSTAKLAEYFNMQNIRLENGQRAEVNLQAHNWLTEIAGHLKQGYLLTIDYGATSRELYSEHRFNGTLRCFHKHHLADNPLINIGRQDITAHVNFSTLITWGHQLGLQKIELTSQPQFLLNLGILDALQKQPDYTPNPELAKVTSAIKQLVLPGGMGDIFKVLVQVKSL